MSTKGCWVAARLAAAGLTALSPVVFRAATVQGATIVALTRLAKGNDNRGAIAVDARLGRVFLANYAARSLRVLDAANGGFPRTIDLGSQPPLAVAVDEATNRVFVTLASTGAKTPARVRVLDARDGHTVRTIDVGAFPQTVVVDEATNRAFVLTGATYLSTPSHGSVDILDATTGLPRGTLAVNGVPIAAAVAGPAGRLFVATSTYHSDSQTWTSALDMRDASSGRLVRTLPLANAASPGGVILATDARMNRLVATYTSLIDTGYGANVRVLDAATGDVLRTLTLRSSEVMSAGTSPSALAMDGATGHAFVTSYDATTYAGRLSILDASTGAILRTSTAGLGRFPISVAAATGVRRLVVIDRDVNDGQAGGSGSVRILDAVSGRLLHIVSLPIGTAIPNDVVTSARLAFMTDVSGVTSVLDLRSGRILHTWWESAASKSS